MFLRQSTASQEIPLGPFLSDSDGVTPVTGLTINNTDIKLWKFGATAEVSKNSGGATHIASGRYYAVLDATDTDTIGGFEANVHMSGALPIKFRGQIVEESIYDGLYATNAGTTNLVPVNTYQVEGLTLSGMVGDNFNNFWQNSGVTGTTVLDNLPTTGTLDTTSGVWSYTGGRTLTTGVTVSGMNPSVINEAAFASDTSKYQAKINLFDDDSNTTDRYVAIWFKNGQPITTGITSPGIQVVKVADGADLIPPTGMTEIGSLGIYRYTETGNRIVNGTAYFVKISGIIDGSTRTWFAPIGRDSSS